MKTMFRVSLVVAAALATLASLATAEECDYSAHREVQLDASGAERLRVFAGAGSLRIIGREGATMVRAEGRACSSSSSLLDQVRIETDRKGDVLTVRVEIPDSAFGWRSHAWLDLEMDVPSNLEVEVDDGSGSVIIRGVAALEIEDGSGEIQIRDIGGDLEISDGSGSITANIIEGTVTIREDGSGSISLTDILGDVEIRDDGSGSITIRRVKGSVHIGEDGSGSITIVDVSGDVIVDDDGSGGIYLDDVGGTISIPDQRPEPRQATGRPAAWCG